VKVKKQAFRNLGPRELILRSEVSVIKTSSGKNEILEGISKGSLKSTSLKEDTMG